MMEDNHKFEFTNLKTSPIGLGAWQIGDRLFWSYGRTHQYEDSYEALLQSLNHGVNFIDTAEVYGFGMSERMIGGMLQKIGARPVISTKYFPYPWRLTSNSVVLALKRSLSRLHLEHVELYQIHWPIPSFLISTWAKGLIEIARTGLARYIGVSNFTHNQVKRMYRLLNENDIQLVSNQVEYNLLNRRIEKNGLMDLCNQLGIKIIAYSPLAQGLLTGKYDYERPGSGLRKLTYAKLSQEKLRVLVGRMRDIGSNYGGKTPAQVAINWLICKGVVPIPGAKNGQQAQENAGALGWRLSEEDVIGLEKSSDGIWKNE